jgi:hypothetical protein
MKNSFGLGRSKKQMWENLQLIAAILVLVLSVLSFFLYQSNRLIFALVFFAAALMQFFAGCVKMTPNDQHKRSLKAAIFWYFCAVFFLALAVLTLLVKF